MSTFADSTTVDLALHWPAAAARHRARARTEDFDWGSAVRLVFGLVVDVLVAGCEFVAVAAVVFPFDDRLVTFWPIPALLFLLLLLWRWRR